MGAALALGERGRGISAPNPNVGCVVVREGRVVGRGWTQAGGRPHAEAMALAEAGAAARGATVYTTLEPCVHRSPRGPACADLLVEAGVARVVAAMVDPDPRTAGGGLRRLADAGVAVTTGVLQRAAWTGMAGWLTRQALARPLVTLKLALSLDGAVAMADGRSRWITGPEARAHAHGERSRHPLILVGRGTWDADRPRLDVRLAGLEARSRQSPSRHARAGRDDGGGANGGVIWIDRPEAIGGLPGDHLLVEGGAGAAAAFLRAGLVDRLLLYRAPIVVGGGLTLPDIGLAELADAHGRWRLDDARRLGADRLEVYGRR